MTTPTRDMVLDALLAERIDWGRHTTVSSFNELLDAAARAEMEATDAVSYEAIQCAILDRYHHGKEVLEEWKLVQSETFDGEDLAQAEAAWDARRTLGVVGHLVNVYYGYITTHEHMRYVGLAPRQEQEEA